MALGGPQISEAVENSEVAEACEVDEASGVAKGSEITTEDFRVIQLSSLNSAYFDVLLVF